MGHGTSDKTSKFRRQTSLDKLQTTAIVIIATVHVYDLSIELKNNKQTNKQKNKHNKQLQ